MSNLALAILHTEPPASATSPARQRLSLAHDEMREATAELTNARIPFDRCRAQQEAAKAHHASALADLGAVSGRERAAYVDWLRAGTGVQPAPLTAEREAAQAAVDEAAHQFATIEGAIAETQPAVADAAQRHADLSRQLDGLLEGVIEEELAILSAEHRRLLAEIDRSSARINSAFAWAHGRGHALANAGDHGGAAAWHQRAARLQKRLEDDLAKALPGTPSLIECSARWNAFAQALLSDPAAVFEG